jgi:cytochrome c553
MGFRGLGVGVFAAVAVVGAAVFLVGSTRAQSGGAAALPTWAYPVDAPRPAGVKPAAAVDGGLLHVPGSSAGYTKAQIGNLFFVPDWFPEGHPQMPDVVAEGRKPDVGACGHCHLPNGLGRPENQSVAGLPVAYMMEQMEDFKNGLRKSSEAGMPSVQHMILVAKGATPEEMKAGAEYFAAMKLTPWIRVVETATVPKTHSAGGMLVVEEGGGTEAIGQRVIEVSEDLEQTELRNPKSGFVAYVPVGSLKRGEKLVKTGGKGETTACTLCHGADLKGVGNVPSIAGRSPSQMTRQIIDFQRGSRNGVGAQMMKGPVAKLKIDDVVAITGYLASLKP